MRKFNTSMNGYNKEEVNSFVNQVISEYEKMLNTLKDRDVQIKNLNDQLKYYSNMEDTLNKAINLADESSNQIKNIAREEARMIVEGAKRNASRIVNDSLLKAEKVDIETEQLRRRLKSYKKRIKQVIEDQLDMVKEIDEIEY